MYVCRSRFARRQVGTHLKLLSELDAQLLEVVIVFGHDVLGDGLVAAVRLVQKHALLEEAPEQRAQQLGLLHAQVQLPDKFTAQNKIYTCMRVPCSRMLHSYKT